MGKKKSSHAYEKHFWCSPESISCAIHRKQCCKLGCQIDSLPSCLQMPVQELVDSNVNLGPNYNDITDLLASSPVYSC